MVRLPAFSKLSVNGTDAPCASVVPVVIQGVAARIADGEPGAGVAEPATALDVGAADAFAEVVDFDASPPPPEHAASAPANATPAAIWRTVRFVMAA